MKKFYGFTIRHPFVSGMLMGLILLASLAITESFIAPAIVFVLYAVFLLYGYFLDKSPYQAN
ncbi:MAG: hypothetical protein NTX82_02410 [Candidatus Parcubacteria bacterium]|nr:hypothetical protein [Candidatus Parcubacteria bacterium]